MLDNSLAIWEKIHKQVKADYADYLEMLEKETEKRHVSGPHCDRLVLHTPGICQFCDLFPILQAFRREQHITFTGEPQQDGERPCPATLFRSVELIHHWNGNLPYEENKPNGS